MYTLYYSPGSCSMSVHIALRECGAEVKLEKIDLSLGQNRTPDYLALNPRGAVPTLVEDGRVIREGVAQMIHILEQHHSPLLPQSEPLRSVALEWMLFCNATLHPAYGRVFFLKRHAMEGDAREVLMDIACKNINDLWRDVEGHLQVSRYLCGDHVTMADIMLTVIANWSRHVPRPIVMGPRTKELFREMIARPAYAQALAIEQVEYVAAS